MPIDALSVLCAQLTRDLLAIAKFLFIFFTTEEWGILGDFLPFLAIFYETWRNDCRRQGNKSKTFWQRSGSGIHPDPDSGSALIRNPDSNPGSLSVDI